MVKIISFFIFLLPLFVFPQSSTVNIEPLKTSIIQTTVSVGTTATALPATALSGRKSIVVKNLGTAVLYLGSSTTTANLVSTGGFQLAQNDVFTADYSDDVVLYGIVASGTNNVNVLEAR